VIRVFVIDAIGNVALFALAYYWLGLPAASTGHLALSILVPIILAALAAYLMAFAFNRDARAAVSRIPVMLLWLVIAGMSFALILFALGYVNTIDNWINSALTLLTRKPVQLPYMGTIFRGIGAFLFALILLPAAARAVVTGQLKDFRPVNKRNYLLATAGYLFLGLWLPWTLFWWIPRVESFGGQMTSFLLRMTIAFSLYIGAWLVFAWYCRAQALAPEAEHAR
jgi:hypothetical protein